MQEKRRRTVAVILFAAIAVLLSFYNYQQTELQPPQPSKQLLSTPPQDSEKALSVIEKIDVKGRAPKTDYSRSKFSSGWSEVSGCDMRNLILKRDLSDTFIDPLDNCKVIRGKLNDPYTGKLIDFQRGEQSSQAVQIDHVVALSDAWQKGAQQVDEYDRSNFANDPLNLLAVDGPANQKKGDGDAATWLPANKPYRCLYVARQIAVKIKYKLWVTLAEKEAMKRQLQACPDQVLPVESSGG